MIGGTRHNIRRQWRGFRDELRYRLFRLHLDRKEAGRDVTAVILTCDPNPLFDACLASVEAQSLRPTAVEVVRNISPVSLAEQRGLECVKTPYYVSVDADMVVKRDFFERLFFLMHQDSGCAQTSIRVRDPLLGPIFAGGRMYRTDPVKAIGYHPFEGTRDHDRYMTACLTEQGFSTVRKSWIGGVHHPIYQPHEAFWKFRVNAEKARYYGDRDPSFRDMADRIIAYWNRTHDDVALYALAGLFEGLKTKSAENELSYEGREDDKSFLQIQAFLEAAGTGS